MSYSNLGYLVLGRLIESVSGQKYEDYVKKEILSPLGIVQMKLGRARLKNRDANEVHYYDAKKRIGPSLYPPNVGRQVPAQYGADNFEAYEAHGGWIASAVEIVKFSSAFDRPAQCPISALKRFSRCGLDPKGWPARTKMGNSKRHIMAAVGVCGQSAPRASPTFGTRDISADPKRCWFAAGTGSIGPCCLTRTTIPEGNRWLPRSTPEFTKPRTQLTDGRTTTSSRTC